MNLIARSIIGICFTSVALAVMVAAGNTIQHRMGMGDDLAIALAIGAPVVLVCVGIIGLLFWATVKSSE